ncbi:MAG: MotA/TolQ/ExbB proton channel family protein [Gammaproteobacteria bacterium]|nr:MotA/TolQ/ExbB proton channel family protein [Gammaproteobacteria bacterium]
MAALLIDAVDLLVLGGPVVLVLGLFSLAALTVALAKAWQWWHLRPLRGATVTTALDHLERGERHQALLLVKGQRNPRAHLLAQTLELLDDPALDLAALRDEALRQARTAVSQLASHLRVLEVVAGLAPLLGLFGTVLGMIEAFQAMEGAGTAVDPAVLSGGIWKALLTTAAGLAVAIPVALAHGWFERRVEVEAATLRDDLDRVFTCVARSPRAAAATRGQQG